jgi:hypothetical protein
MSCQTLFRVNDAAVLDEYYSNRGRHSGYRFCDDYRPIVARADPNSVVGGGDVFLARKLSAASVVHEEERAAAVVVRHAPVRSDRRRTMAAIPAPFSPFVHEPPQVKSRPPPLKIRRQTEPVRRQAEPAPVIKKRGRGRPRLCDQKKERAVEHIFLDDDEYEEVVEVQEPRGPVYRYGDYYKGLKARGMVGGRDWVREEYYDSESDDGSCEVFGPGDWFDGDGLSVSSPAGDGLGEGFEWFPDPLGLNVLVGH